MSQDQIDNPTLTQPHQVHEHQSVFSLKRSNSSSTAPVILVDYSLSQPLQSDPLFTSVNLVPQFNRDKKFYTPSFILESEINRYLTNDEGYRMIHMKKIEQMEEEKIEIFVPKPSRANSYCCICREPFSDYLTHTNLDKHMELMKRSIYYTEIQHLCRDYNPIHCENNVLMKENKKNSITSMTKNKKIVKTKSLQQPKRGRGRPRKQPQNKIQMLASIPTSVSISL